MILTTNIVRDDVDEGKTDAYRHWDSSPTMFLLRENESNSAGRRMIQPTCAQVVLEGSAVVQSLIEH